MWLINVQTLKLEMIIELKDGYSNPYYILSHTWGNDEVSFQEFQAFNGSFQGADLNRLGLSKILRTCDIARAADVLYAWVDTCCIDKSSSAELSESINSMFSWYKRSKGCIVFLDDVAPDVPIEEGLARSRWMTRGWTLQELIAPDVVDFYDQTWARRGKRSGLSQALTQITGIHQEILDGHQRMKAMSRVLVAEKMSWMGDRETTRTEDLAYCLLGIFDINMPLLYGEGERAFMRLQEEIARQSFDQSIFAWESAEARRFCSVFARRPAWFSHIKNYHIRRRSLPFKELTIHGKRVKMEAKLFLIDGSLERGMALDIEFRSREPALSSSYKVAFVSLSKTSGGYIRLDPGVYMVTPQSLSQKKYHPLSTVYLLFSYDEANVDADIRIHMLFSLRDENLQVVSAWPQQFWVPDDRWFLDPGSGITGWLLIKYSTKVDGNGTKAFLALLLVSTEDEVERCHLIRIESDEHLVELERRVRHTQEVGYHPDSIWFEFTGEELPKANTYGICALNGNSRLAVTMKKRGFGAVPWHLFIDVYNP